VSIKIRPLHLSTAVMPDEGSRFFSGTVPGLKFFEVFPSATICVLETVDLHAFENVVCISEMASRYTLLSGCSFYC
jgi:hypothetical protein